METFGFHDLFIRKVEDVEYVNWHQGGSQSHAVLSEIESIEYLNHSYEFRNKLSNTSFYGCQWSMQLAILAIPLEGEVYLSNN